MPDYKTMYHKMLNTVTDAERQLIYHTDDGLTHIDVKIEDETVWLTQAQMSELFQTLRTNIVEHI